jgi:hypothetical protein
MSTMSIFTTKFQIQFCLLEHSMELVEKIIKSSCTQGWKHYSHRFALSEVQLYCRHKTRGV